MNPQVKCPWLFHENWVEIGLVANKKNNNRSSPIFIHFPWESCVLWAIRPGQLQPLRPEVWQGHPEPLVLFGMPFMGSCWVLKSIEIQPQPSLWTNFWSSFQSWCQRDTAKSTRHWSWDDLGICPTSSTIARLQRRVWDLETDHRLPSSAPSATVAELGHQTSTSDAHRRGGRWGVHCSVPRGSGFRCRTWGWRMGSEG